VTGLRQDFEACNGVTRSEASVDWASLPAEWRDPVLASRSSVVGDAAAFEVVGFDLAHRERGTCVIAEPCRGAHVVTMGMGDDVLDHVAAA
jgi:hypothetical protein